MAARYSEIEEYIMNKIHTGEWPIGYKIPKEVELCEQFGVSRSTVRNAIIFMVFFLNIYSVKELIKFLNIIL